jgi:tRNA-dihydrouridine synthase
MMAEAAAYNIDRGAQIIDINMGCPAKKVCNKWAGSALMQRRAARRACRSWKPWWLPACPTRRASDA